MRLDCSLDDAAQLCPQFSELIQDHGGNRELWVKRLMRDLWTTMGEPIVTVLRDGVQPPLGSQIWWLSDVKNSLFSGRMMQGRIEMTTRSLRAHPLSHLIRADASGIASVVSFASRGSSSAECRSKTTRTASGGARDSQDSGPRRACPLDVLFENYQGRCGY